MRLGCHWTRHRHNLGLTTNGSPPAATLICPANNTHSQTLPTKHSRPSTFLLVATPTSPYYPLLCQSISTRDLLASFEQPRPLLPLPKPCSSHFTTTISRRPLLLFNSCPSPPYLPGVQFVGRCSSDNAAVCCYSSTPSTCIVRFIIARHSRRPKPSPPPSC